MELRIDRNIQFASAFTLNIEPFKTTKNSCTTYGIPLLNFNIHVTWSIAGLMLEGDSGEEVALWLLTSLCTSAKREVEIALLILTVLTVKHRYIFYYKISVFQSAIVKGRNRNSYETVLRIRTRENNVGIVSFHLFGV